MKKNESLYDVHFNHVEWENKLKFYADEIKIFTNRLGEIASKNTNNDILIKVEHFQNQFIIQKNNIDEIIHKIHIGENEIQDAANSNLVAVDHRRVGDHSPLREEVNYFEKSFSELKNDYNLFSTQWM